MDHAVTKALDALELILHDDNAGFRLEAAREILKFAAATQ